MIQALKVFWTSFIIGWEDESNWTYKPVYFIYATLRPFAMCLILYYLFKVATDNPAADPAFHAVYVGNAFFTIFMAISAGIGWVIIMDREFYRIIKYIYIAPMQFSLYVTGRASLVMMVSIFGTLIILVFGRFALKLPFGFAEINWGLLIVSFVLGIASSGALGMMLAGFMLITARHATLLAEGIGGIFLLLCGVIYPVDFLPDVWQKVALGIPLTYWMEATRRAFGLAPFGEIMGGFQTTTLMMVLAAFAAGYVAAAWVIFKYSTYLATKYGKIDQVTHH